MQEELEQLRKYIDLCERKVHYHLTQIDNWNLEINKTNIAIENLRKKLATITDFKTAKELVDEQQQTSQTAENR